MNISCWNCKTNFQRLLFSPKVLIQYLSSMLHHFLLLSVEEPLFFVKTLSTSRSKHENNYASISKPFLFSPWTVEYGVAVFLTTTMVVIVVCNVESNYHVTHINKLEISSSSESSLISSRLISILLALLTPSSLPSLSCTVPKEGAKTYSSTCLNLFAPLISYIRKN